MSNDRAPFATRELIAPGITAETDYVPPYEAIHLAAIASELFGDDELERYAREEAGHG